MDQRFLLLPCYIFSLTLLHLFRHRVGERFSSSCVQKEFVCLKYMVAMSIFMMYHEAGNGVSIKILLKLPSVDNIVQIHLRNT